jgi:hypothetical protein
LNAWKIIKTIAIALSLTACVAPSVHKPPQEEAPAPKLNLNDFQAVAKAISVERDDFKKINIYMGPAITETKYNSKNLVASLGAMDSVVLISALKYDDAGKVSYQIYVSDYYGGVMNFYNSAYDSNGNRLHTTLINKKIHKAEYISQNNETLVLDVTREYLEKNQESGIRFKLSGKNGDAIFSIPAGYIKGFLSVVEPSASTNLK